MIGAGHFCPFPFLFNGQYYDQCTRRKKDGSIYGLEDEYWCPSPFNTTIIQGHFFGANIFYNGGQTGICSDFPVPIGKQHYFIFTCRKQCTLIIICSVLI